MCGCVRGRVPQLGVSRGHVKVEDVKKKTEAVVVAVNLPIQVGSLSLLEYICQLKQLTQFIHDCVQCTACYGLLALEAIAQSDITVLC